MTPRMLSAHFLISLGSTGELRRGPHASERRRSMTALRSPMIRQLVEQTYRAGVRRRRDQRDEMHGECSSAFALPRAVMSSTSGPLVNPKSHSGI